MGSEVLSSTHADLILQRGTDSGGIQILRATITILIKHQSNPISAHPHPPGDGASQSIQHDAEQPDRHLPGSAWSGSDASSRVGLAIQC